MRRWLILPALLAATPALADELTLSGSVRVRYEALDGQPRAGLAEEDEQLAIRTILTAQYDAQPITLFAELYDSRAYLTPRGGSISANDVNALEPVQAFITADLGDVLGKGTRTRVTAGRFTLNLGARRLVAADDYRNTTNGYTGLRTDLDLGGGTSAVLIYTLPQVRLPDDRPGVLDNEVVFDREGFDLRLWGGYLAKAKALAGATAELGYIRLDERDRDDLPTRNRKLDNVSLRVIRAPAAGKIDFEAEGIYQFGSVRGGLAADAPLLDVSASFVHADIGYSFRGPLKARLSVEYDRASGDRPGRRFERFDTLFGMRRAELAPAGIYAAIGRANISTPGLRIEAERGRIDGFAVARALWAASKTDGFSTTGVRDPSGRSGRFAGYQFEGRLRWWTIPERLRAELNWAFLVKRGLLRTAPNAPASGDTRYLSLAMTASF